MTLSPRLDTGEEIDCTASDGNSLFGASQLIEITGNNLIPGLTKGVLFAQGTMYRPSTPPALSAAPVNTKSYLYYSSTAGWYWSASSTPTASDDAYVGWVATDAREVVAVSSSRIGTGAEAQVVLLGPQLLAGSVAGDTGKPVVAPTYAFGPDEQGRLILQNLGFTDITNLAGVFSVGVLLWYADLIAGPVATLTSAMGAGDNSLTASAPLPATTAPQVSFQFHNSNYGGQIIGPGYLHNIFIGANEYGYVQQIGDTAVAIAAALADTINAANDLHAMAVASGPSVILLPLRNDGSTVPCTASDANSPQTLTETLPSYVLIDTEIISVAAADGSSIARAKLGSTAAAHTSGTNIYALQTMTLYFAIDGELIGTADWPAIIGTIPFVGKALEATHVWVTNEFGDSPIGEFCYAAAAMYSGFPGIISIAPPREITAATTISPSDRLVAVNSTAAGWTQTLPASNLLTAPVTMKKTSADTNAVILHGHGGDLIDAVATYTLTTPGDFVTLQPLAKGGWKVIAQGTTGGGGGGSTGDPQNPLTYASGCGDGVTDATAAIASAIATGGLHLPSGSVFLTSEIVLSHAADGFTIYGGGRLKLKAAAGTPLISIDHTNDMKIVDVRLDGNSATGTGHAVLALDTVADCSIRGVLIVGGQGAGISLANVSTCRISDCNAAAESPGLAVTSSTYMAWGNTGIADREGL